VVLFFIIVYVECHTLFGETFAREAFAKFISRNIINIFIHESLSRKMFCIPQFAKVYPKKKQKQFRDFFTSRKFLLRKFLSIKYIFRDFFTLRKFLLRKFLPIKYTHFPIIT